jgi:leucyl-tRNA synthetase
MFDADVTASDDTLKAAAMELPEVKKWVGEKAIKKVIVVKGRLVSIVI